MLLILNMPHADPEWGGRLPRPPHLKMLKTAQKWAHPAGDSHLKVLSTLVCCAQPVSANFVSALFMHRSVLVQNYLGKQMSVGTRCILAANSWTGLMCLFGRGDEHNGTIVCLQGGWEEVKWADAISISGFPIGRWQTFLQPAPWWSADFVKIIIFFCCQHIGYVTLENYAIILQTVKTQQTPAGGQWWEKTSAWSLLQSCWSTRLWLHKAPLLLLGFHWVIFNPPSIRHCKGIASLYAPHLGLKIVPFPRVGKKMSAMPIAGGKSPDAWPSGIQQIW